MQDIPATMRGVVLTGHGGPEKLEWRKDLPVPRPAPGQVLIKVGASAVNNTDINTRVGWYSKAVRGDTASGTTGFDDSPKDGGWSGALAFPRIQGADCCGRIVAVGGGVDPSRIGERVMVRPMHPPMNPESDLPLITFGSEYDGGFADYTVTWSEHALPVASDLTDVELASFPCAFSTAEGMMQRAALGTERVLITGASGGVGSAAIQLAKRRGAHVTAVTSPAKADTLRDLGADAVLRREEALPGNAFDVVLDLVGGPRWPLLLGALHSGGRYAVAGAIAGPIVELDLRTLYLKDLTLLGCTKQAPSVFTDLIGYVERGEIRPLIAETYPLRDIRAAQAAFQDKGYTGKIGLTLDD